MISISTVYDVLLTALFPRTCIGCGAQKSYLCNTCLGKIELLNEIRYATTTLPHLTRGPLRGVIPAARYRSSTILVQAIQAFKYKRITALGSPLSSLLIKRIDSFMDARKGDWMAIPIPLHSHKYRVRGFNQNEILIQKLTRAYELPCLCGKKNPLKRIRSHTSQTHLRGKERRENVKGIFTVDNKQIISGKNILLVDDVMTTGATLREAAYALKNAGAREIWGAVLACD